MTKRYFPTRTMPSPCPGCSCTTGKETMVTGVFNCASCGGVVGSCYRGEAMAMVEIDKDLVNDRECPDCVGGFIPHTTLICSKCGGTRLKRIPNEDIRYFDFTFLDEGIRIHGFFDRVSLRVVQWG